MLQAISHIALVVRDPARTAALFHDLFGADALRREDEDGHFETFGSVEKRVGYAAT